MKVYIPPHNFPNETPITNMAGKWIGNVNADNYGGVIISLTNSTKYSSLHGSAIFTDIIYGQVIYTVEIEVSGLRVRGFYRMVKIVEERQNIYHSPLGLIAGYLSQDGKELRGVYVASTGRSGEFVTRKSE